MFRRHDHDDAELSPLGRHALEPDLTLRDERDPDPLVEEATQRLRDRLQSLEAVDEWGRPLPWRHVARIALGSLVTPRVRDAVTADALAEAVAPEPTTAVSHDTTSHDSSRSVSPDTTDRSVQWQSFFRAVDDTDRLLPPSEPSPHA